MIHFIENGFGLNLKTAFAAISLAIIGLLVHSTSASAQELDIEKIFFCPAGDMSEDDCLYARDTTLITCTACHVFTPFVKAQKTEEEWDSFLESHRGRVEETSDEDYEDISKFLKSHFNPDNPVPQLPPELENYSLPPA
ncbi:MAG: hypothetical protein CMG46_09720 [Candidatus Marinimicrobia bacterium]|nr:hypothetical protein [Candidatus Neomarinimicrobiota bacterium]|tara:strand:- start:285 stop:701 length:417 start_codon:yes stop_codon:yes gene_type:complete